MELPASGRLWIALSSVLVALSKGDDPCFAVNERAELSCEVTLTGGLSLRTTEWIKLGSPPVLVADLLGAAPAYTGRATVNATGFLLLDNVQEDDKGTYSCTGTLSDFTSIPTVMTELRVDGVPVNTCPSIAAADEFENITLVCNTTACDASTIEWENLPSGTVPTVTDSEVTVTFNVKKSYEGTYVCKAVNSFGEGTCRTNLTVPRYQPIVRTILATIIVVDKIQSVNVSVTVEGNPKPDITWYRNGTLIHNGNSLVIYSTMPGNYTCLATNDIGEVSCGTFIATGTVWKFVLAILAPTSAAVGVAVCGVVCWKKKGKPLNVPINNVEVKVPDSSGEEPV